MNPQEGKSLTVADESKVFKGRIQVIINQQKEEKMKQNLSKLFIILALVACLGISAPVLAEDGSGG